MWLWNSISQTRGFIRSSFRRRITKNGSHNAGDEVTLSGKKQKWEEYAFSWQYGVEGDYGHQGYHGLKGVMYDNFIRLGAMKDVKMSKERQPELSGNYYILYTSVLAPLTEHTTC